jgi:DNA-binding response OmpR family regulator
MHSYSSSPKTQAIAVYRVLIVESDCAVASMLQTVLSEAHIPSMVTRSKHDALLVLKGLRPLLMLVNTHLSDGSGIALYDELCQRLPPFTVPTLILTTNLSWCEQQLAQRHLTSMALPLDIDTFVETISALLPSQLL